MSNIVSPQFQTAQTVGARKVDASLGSHSGELSRQWYKRPDDQRFLSLTDLYASVRGRGDRSHHMIADAKTLRVNAIAQDDGIELILPDGTPTTPTHWAFGQMCNMVKAPASYLRALPAQLAAINLGYGLRSFREEDVKPFWTDGEDGQGVTLRAMTSTSYGRIMDAEVVEAVMRIAPDGSGWKVPGTMDWGSGIYDPNTAVTKQSTTLYASDRDVFIFMCRDQNPIEVGKLSNGDPDLLFPGFIVSNSETGAAALKIETMFLRAVCMNRNLWGIEDRKSTVIRHTSGAPDRFIRDAEPALLEFSREASLPVRNRVMDAKRAIVADNDDERVDFLRKRDFSKTAAKQILDEFSAFEGRPAESVWDMVQAITLKARDIPHQDDRVDMERAAGKLMALA